MTRRATCWTTGCCSAWPASSTDHQAFEVEPEEGRLTADGIGQFLQFNHSVNEVALNFDLLDIAAHGGEPDGYVSPNDLRAAAEDLSLPAGLPDAASFLLANGMLTQRIQAYEHANLGPHDLRPHAGGQTLTDDVAGFDREGVIALAMDQQAFLDPADARRFVLDCRCPTPTATAACPSAWCPTRASRHWPTRRWSTPGDLSDSHAVIAHLPETTGWNGSRGRSSRPAACATR